MCESVSVGVRGLAWLLSGPMLSKLQGRGSLRMHAFIPLLLASRLLAATIAVSLLGKDPPLDEEEEQKRLIGSVGAADKIVLDSPSC